MRAITALLETHNDALRLGRCLETLYPCDGILIFDSGSTDGTVQIARDYGATVLISERNGIKLDGKILGKPAPRAAAEGWILSLNPRESLSEALAASLYEWKSQHAEAQAFSVFVREETPTGWVLHGTSETRLTRPDLRFVNPKFPHPDVPSVDLDGELLQFAFP